MYSQNWADRNVRQPAHEVAPPAPSRITALPESRRPSGRDGLSLSLTSPTTTSRNGGGVSAVALDSNGNLSAEPDFDYSSAQHDNRNVYPPARTIIDHSTSQSYGNYSSAFAMEPWRPSQHPEGRYGQANELLDPNQLTTPIAIFDAQRGVQERMQTSAQALHRQPGVPSDIATQYSNDTKDLCQNMISCRVAMERYLKIESDRFKQLHGDFEKVLYDVQEQTRKADRYWARLEMMERENSRLKAEIARLKSAAKGENISPGSTAARSGSVTLNESNKAETHSLDLATEAQLLKQLENVRMGGSNPQSSNDRSVVVDDNHGNHNHGHQRNQPASAMPPQHAGNHNFGSNHAYNHQQQPAYAAYAHQHRYNSYNQGPSDFRLHNTGRGGHGGNERQPPAMSNAMVPYQPRGSAPNAGGYNMPPRYSLGVPGTSNAWTAPRREDDSWFDPETASWKGHFFRVFELVKGFTNTYLDANLYDSVACDGAIQSNTQLLGFICRITDCVKDPLSAFRHATHLMSSHETRGSFVNRLIMQYIVHDIFAWTLWTGISADMDRRLERCGPDSCNAKMKPLERARAQAELRDIVNALDQPQSPAIKDKLQNLGDGHVHRLQEIVGPFMLHLSNNSTVQAQAAVDLHTIVDQAKNLSRDMVKSRLSFTVIFNQCAIKFTAAGHVCLNRREDPWDLEHRHMRIMLVVFPAISYRDESSANIVARQVCKAQSLVMN